MDSQGGVSNLLIVEDDSAVAESLASVLERPERRVTRAENVAGAIAALESEDIHLVILDHYLPDGSGLDVLRHAQGLVNKPNVVYLTACSEAHSIMEASRQGVFQWVPKPVNGKELCDVVQAALRRVMLDRKCSQASGSDVTTAKVGTVVARSREMLTVLSKVGRLCRTDASVLITGESGVGKEVVARLLHKMGPRKDLPFVAINCASIPETLLESELFGYERGAFTGASAAKNGLFESADRGTLLLDEIGTLGLPLQAKLLRAIEERATRRLGSNQLRYWNVRILSATNSDLRELMQRREFRPDLYYRLAVASIEIPPLRERREDIQPLVSHFCDLNTWQGAARRVTSSALSALEQYAWPGNVRELENVVAGAAALSHGGAIDLDDLPVAIARRDSRLSPPVMADPEERADTLTLRNVARRHATEVFRKCGGNKTRAALQLGIDKRTLTSLLQGSGEATDSGRRVNRGKHQNSIH